MDSLGGKMQSCAIAAVGALFSIWAFFLAMFSFALLLAVQTVFEFSVSFYKPHSIESMKL